MRNRQYCDTAQTEVYECPGCPLFQILSLLNIWRPHCIAHHWCVMHTWQFIHVVSTRSQNLWMWHLCQPCCSSAHLQHPCENELHYLGGVSFFTGSQWASSWSCMHVYLTYSNSQKYAVKIWTISTQNQLGGNDEFSASCMQVKTPSDPLKLHTCNAYDGYCFRNHVG